MKGSFLTDNIQEIIQALKVNKVNVPITPNHMNEQEVFKGVHVPLVRNFNAVFEDMLSNFKKMPHSSYTRTMSSSQSHTCTSMGGNMTTVSQRRDHTRDHARDHTRDTKKFTANFTENIHPTKHNQSTEKIEDPFMYCLCCHIDKMLSLFGAAEANKKVATMKQDLCDNLTNHHQAYKKLGLKSTKNTADEIKEFILDPCRQDFKTILTYFALLMHKNMVFEQQGKDATDLIVPTSTDENDSYVHVQGTLNENGTLMYSFNEVPNGFRELKAARMQQKIAQYRKVENLKKLVVKDLKEIATELEIPLIKVVEGKKISLLKEELVGEILKRVKDASI